MCVEQGMCVHVHRTKEVVYVSECVCVLKVFTLLTTRRQDSQKFCLIGQHMCMHHCACSVTFEGVHSHTHKTQDY